MSLVFPERVFLDSCMLKRLARGEWPQATEMLRTRIARARSVVIVTGDHIADYGDCTAAKAAMGEAQFVDALHPLWMIPGDGIYHREAFSEYLRLTGGQGLPRPFPTRIPSEALLQWARDCRCLPEVRCVCEALARSDHDPTFSGKLRGGFQQDQLGLWPRREDRLALKDQYSANRAWARRHGLSEEQWNHHFRQKWIRRLLDPPAEPPGADLDKLASKVEFSRMPAWMAWIGVEKTWHKGQTVPKQSDLVDVQHLALLPYVDVFITEKNLASMVKQAKVAGRTFVSSSIREWAERVCD